MSTRTANEKKPSEATETRTCRACGARWCDPEDFAFVTCPACRIPSPDLEGGCRNWDGVWEGIRTTKHDDMTVQKTVQKTVNLPRGR